MLEIKPVTEKNIVEKLCIENNFLYNNEYLSYTAVNNGQTLGLGIFYIRENTLYLDFLDCINPNDTSLLDGIFRAILNYGLANNATEYKLGSTISTEIIEIILKINPNTMANDIQEFFKSCKSCH